MSTRAWLTAALAASLGLIGLSCENDCRDQFDCRNDGLNFVCVQGHCVAPTGTGTELDGGVDGGLDGGPDAGIDAGTDAGLDGGLDGGRDAGPDGG
jgi:hypothetical protein